MNDDAGAAGTPLVSVVIPTYNREAYIAETLASVLDQTHRNLDVIVIDDGSTDNTAGAVEPFVSRIRYIRQENAERGASRNHGLRLAQGDYVAFLDSDDLWLPTKVEEDLAFLRNRPKVGVVYTDSVQIDSDGNALQTVRAGGPSGKVTESLLLRNFVSIGAHLARTALVREIGGFREERQLSGAEDWEMWVRLSLRTEFAYNPVATVKIRTHEENTMTNAAAMRRALGRAAELIHGHEPLATRYRRGLRRMDANLALVNAINYTGQRDHRQSLGFLREAVVADPRIIFDARYVYTMLRLVKSGLGLGRPVRQH